MVTMEMTPPLSCIHMQMLLQLVYTHHVVSIESKTPNACVSSEFSTQT